MSITKIFRSMFAFVLAFVVLGGVLPCGTAKAENAGEKKLIAITFDDGPSSHTSELLDGLEARGAVATFFMCGSNGMHGLKTYHELLSRMYSMGCQLSNHSYSHPYFARLTAQQMAGEIEAVEEWLYPAVGGKYMDLVRIPGGANTERIRTTVAHPMITWSVDPMDWRDRDAEIVYQRIMNGANDGAIILLHDLYPTSIEAGLRAITSLQAQGYEFVTVSELFRRRGIYLENGVVYNSAPNTGTNRSPYVAPMISSFLDPSTGETTVTLSSSSINISSIHYTTDGSVPTLASPTYTEPIKISETTTFRVAGFDRFATRTPFNKRTIRPGISAPQISSVSKNKISLSCATQGAQILYTTNGNDPISHGTLYDRAFTPGDVTKAVAVMDGKAHSNIIEITKTSNGSFFYDLPADAWYYDAVDDVIQRGLMNGVENYKFMPYGYTSRATLVGILYRLEGSPKVRTSHPFQDVSSNEWYADAVAWASANGIVNGVTNTSFEPNGKLTRQQAAVIIQRYAIWSGRKGKDGGTLSNYTDAVNIEAYALPAVTWCVNNGILSEVENNVLAPKAPALRAQCAAMISALCDISVKK